MANDDRFNIAGIISLFEIQENGGVYDALEQSLSNFDIDDYAARKDIDIEVMARKRYKWDINCEKIESTSSDTFFETLLKLRIYFYSTDEIGEFPNGLIGHSHIKEEEHDDYHNGEFHLHVNGIPPKDARLNLLFLHVFFLAYFVAISVVLLYHVKYRPKIVNSYQAMRCQKYKFLCIWFPIVVVMWLCEIYSIMTSYLMADFQYRWVAALNDMNSS